MSQKHVFFVVAFITVLFAISFFETSSAKTNWFAKGSQEELILAKTASLQYLQPTLKDFGIAEKNIKISDVFVDDLNMAHARIQQNVDGIPVFGGEAIVHLNSDGSLFTTTNHLIKNINVNTQPTLNKEHALMQAINEYGCSDCLTSEPKIDLMVLRHHKKDYLVYRVALHREDGSANTALPIYFIDAHTGDIIWSYNNLQTASGTSLYSGTVTITTSKVGTTFYMEDVTKKIGTFDFTNTTTTVSRLVDTDDIWNSVAQKAAVDVHFGVTKTYDYFKNVHGRNGIDGSGGPGLYPAMANVNVKLLSSRVHYGTNYNNAFWNGSSMTFGDGDSSVFTPLVTIDICGHELTHGITERTAGLIYSGQSGALNESMSDIFGAMVERYTLGQSANVWKIGEKCFTPTIANDALRYMDNPHLAGNGGFTSDDDPDHLSEIYTGTSDNGGVHINSGLPNKVFYLLAQGGTHHKGGSMTGVGADVAARIWYKALTSYMTSTTNFAGAKTATVNAAKALYGNTSTQATAVAKAWMLCGVN